MTNEPGQARDAGNVAWSDISEISPKLDEQRFIRFLSDVERHLEAVERDQGAAQKALDDLFLTLQDHKRQLSDTDWQCLVAWCRRHPLLELLHRDPFTSRAYLKPRGYAGDACMMDLIYGTEEHWPTPALTSVGRLVFDSLTTRPACSAVRARRALIAATIDRLAEQRPHPNVMAIAAGHLREVNLSAAVRRRRTGRFVALDSDAESLAEVRECYGKFGIETVTASFRHLLTSDAYTGQFDLVYSTGLFDYLSQRSACRLLVAMHQMLRPGGSLLVANFLPGVRDVGYMEAIMDWTLVYRSRQDMVELTRDIDEAEISGLELWSEEARNIIFLRVTRK